MNEIETYLEAFSFVFLNDVLIVNGNKTLFAGFEDGFCYGMNEIRWNFHLLNYSIFQLLFHAKIIEIT